jgi:hypothetical protein
LQGTRIENAGAALLAGCRDQLPHLATLNLAHNNFTDPEAVSALIAGPGLPALTGLDLWHARVRELDPARLAAPGRGPVLRLLRLGGCSLTAKAMGALVAAPSLTGLVGLSLGFNEIGDGGAAALTRAVNWNRLTCLDLGHNGITGEGVRALLGWSGLKNLSCLDLGNNPIGLDGAKALAGCAALKKCRKIVVSRTPGQIPEDGHQLLRDTFGRRIALD